MSPASVDVGSVVDLRDRKISRITQTVDLWDCQKQVRQIGVKPKMSKNMLNIAKRQVAHLIILANKDPYSINLSHSLSLGTLPYSYQARNTSRLGRVSESCPWQLFYRVERRLKRE